MLNGLPSDVSRFFGVGLFSITNLIFIFESLSTLDSTFTSAAKLFGPEFAGLLEDGTPKSPQRATVRRAPAAACLPCTTMRITVRTFVSAARVFGPNLRACWRMARPSRCSV